jgi:hypothetical protein
MQSKFNEMYVAIKTIHENNKIQFNSNNIYSTLFYEQFANSISVSRNFSRTSSITSDCTLQIRAPSGESLY